MKTKKTLIALGYVFDFAIGYTVGSVIEGAVKPQKVVGHVLTDLGSIALSYVAAKKFNADYASWCGTMFDVDVSDYLAT